MHNPVDTRPVRFASWVFGYRPTGIWTGRWRFVPSVALAVCLVAIFLTTLREASGPLPTTAQVVVHAHLDTFTRSRNPETTNSIPEFVALPGQLGWTAEGTRINPIDGQELMKGFCAPRLATVIRQRFPGVYDELSDAELERRVLEKDPTSEEDLCVLPAWIPAAPSEIIKYDVESLGIAANRRWAVLRALLLSGLFGLVSTNIYYRLVAPLGASGS